MKPASPENEANDTTTTSETKSDDLPKLDIKHIPTSELENIENSESKQKLIFTIQKYQDSSRFGKIVKYELGFKQSFVELSEKTESELENILNRIRSHLDNKNIDKFYENMATSVAITYEQVLSPMYNIDGFTDLLLDNEEFWTCWERYRIESEFPAVNATTQMMFMVGQMTIMAHHLALNPEEHDEMIPPPPLETILEGIENPSNATPPPNEIIIVDNDDKKTSPESTENKTVDPQDIKPVGLGELL